MSPLRIVILSTLLCAIANGLIITGPPEIAGNYLSIPTFEFGGLAPPPPGIADVQVVYVNDGCTPINASILTGKIALIDRGGCFFSSKVRNAQDAGGLAVIIANIYPKDNPLGGYNAMSGVDPVITIPSCWISLEDGLVIKQYLPNVTATFVMNDLVAEEKAALIDLYNNNGGVNWPDQTGWTNFSSDPCHTYWKGTFCGMFGRVVLTNWDSFGLVGNFPSNLSVFKGIIGWSITNNPGFTGTIADNFFENMTDIWIIAIQQNSLSGPIPSSLSKLPQLTQVAFTNNQFNGSIPDIWDSYFPGLFSIDFSINQLSGPIPPTLSNATLVSSLILSGNQLTGSIPDLSALTSLTQLDLSSNQLSGSIGNSLAGCPLTILSLRANQFSGVVPTYIWNADGSIDLASNRFTGPLPSIWDAPLLTSIDISGNDFSGAIPQIDAPSLTTLSLTGNTKLVGPFPTLSVDTTLLADVDVSNVPLNMDILDFFQTMASSLTALTNLRASRCGLTGNIDILDQLPNTLLSTIDISHNAVFGQIEFATVKGTLRYVDMSDNQLNGNPIDSLGSCPLVYFANFTANPSIRATTGDLPSFLGFDYTELSFNSTSHTQCPAIIGTVRPITVLFDRTFNNYAGCQCSEKYRRLNGTCQDCPDHGYCPGGFKEKVVVAQHGFFPLPTADEPVVLAKCRNSSLTSNPCNPHENETFACEIGYTDRLCSNCIAGYFHMSESCKKCGGYIEWITFSFMVVAMGIFLLYIIIVQPIQWKRATFAVVVFFLQTSSYLLSSGSLPVLKKADFVNVAYSVTFLKLVGAECWRKEDGGPVGKFYFVLGLPLGIGILILAGYWGWRGFSYGYYRTTARTRIKRWTLEEIDMFLKRFGMRAMIYAYKLLHFPICVKMFSVFNCIEDPYYHDSYLSDALWLNCSGTAVKGMRGTAILAIILYGFGSLGLFGFMLHFFRPDRMKKLAELPDQDKPWYVKHLMWVGEELGVLHACYRRKYYWAELYFNVRRTLIALAASLLLYDSASLPAVTLIILLASLITHAWTKPFRSPVDNNLELLSLSTIVISYMVSVLLANVGFGNSTDGIQWTLLSFNLIVMICLIGVLLLNSMGFVSRITGKKFVVNMSPRMKRVVEKFELTAFVHENKDNELP